MTKSATNTAKIVSTIAKSDDGTIQITYRFPWEIIEKKRQDTLADLGKTVDVPGFRKGKAPLDKVKEKISPEMLIEKTLSTMLAHAFADSITEHRLNPIVYPKFEVIKADENSDWEVRAQTCEVTDFDLGDYKQVIAGEGRAKKLWTPGDADKKSRPEKLSPQEKEKLVLETLLKNIKVTVPKMLVDEEVNTRLSQLLDKIDKLGLSLETYLSSLGKSVDTLKGEYRQQATSSLALELILNKISAQEKITVDENEINETLKVTKASQPESAGGNEDELRRIVVNFLTRRKTIETLSALL